MLPGRTLALFRVEQDTTLPFTVTPVDVMSYSRIGEADSLLATPTTLMPAARVRLLRVDSATHNTLTAEGIVEREAVAFLRAAPYRADCRTIRWSDTVPFVERGAVGYARGALAPREQWVNGLPLIIITDVWNYPYPHRRGLAFGLGLDMPLAPAEALFSLNAVLEMPGPANVDERSVADSTRRDRALAWARANVTSAELEPVRGLIRRVVLQPDWEIAQGIPSRLRGTYRVDLQTNGQKTTWFFRTHDRPGYIWRGADSLRSTADFVMSPFVAGYRLVGYAASSADSLRDAAPRGGGSRGVSLVWLASTDQPTAPNNKSRSVLAGILEFNLSAAPEHTWDILEPFVPRQSAQDSVLLARLGPRPRGQRQPQIPLTIRLDKRGKIRADTSVVVAEQTLRIALERIDTLSVRRPF
jgi:hypothetical protein